MKRSQLSRQRIPLRFLLLLLLCPLASSLYADSPPGPGDPPHTWLQKWSFSDTNSWLTELDYAAVSWTNLNASDLGKGHALVLDSTNAAWLQYNIFEEDDTTNLMVNNGSLMFWFGDIPGI